MRGSARSPGCVKAHDRKEMLDVLLEDPEETTRSARVGSSALQDLEERLKKAVEYYEGNCAEVLSDIRLRRIREAKARQEADAETGDQGSEGPGPADPET
jgi:hypothetical protein